MHTNRQFVIAALLTVGGLVTQLPAQERPEIEVRTVQLAENVYMLAGAGGNLALSAGDHGALLVDSEYAQLTEKVTAAVKEVCETPIRFVINTHWHFDHVGGNEAFTKAGALIVAHENVRKRMSSAQVLEPMERQVPPSPAAALPVITYADALTFHWNGDQVQVIHVEPAHTDGDSLVYFRKANVLHMGDVWFNGMYPFIDVNAGGSIDGMVKAAERGLALANDKTKIIPGHGPLSNVKELREYRDMLATVRDRVRPMVREGKSREEVIAAKPTKDLDEKWGRGGFGPDMWVGIVYDGMSKE
ncbi:MAG TPA: MBL fold metallo-hydrolase [Phycisphaerae bacterium]|nr:MBL fold metallo-hydrolase [Phycisphaerae bacterium]